MSNWTSYYTPAIGIIWRFQVVWGQISLFLGVFGNSFVLYATTVHNAIKLDKMSVWIIQNLAVADICNCVLVLLPILLNQYEKLNQTSIFETNYYSVMGCYRLTFFAANLFLVNILSFNKVLRCIFPLRNLNSTRRQRIFMTVITVLVVCLPSIFIIYGLQEGFLFVSNLWRNTHYLGAVGVSYVHRDNNTIGWIWWTINFVLLGIFNAIPCITLVVLNSALVIFALKKANTTTNKMNLLIVVLVTVAFLISTLPHFVSFFLNNAPLEYNEIAWSLGYLSFWFNPIIYVAVNPAFREFTKKLVFSWKRKLSNQQ